MAKKKQSVQATKIDNINIEIDYDKLAESIVKANQATCKSEEHKNKKSQKFRTQLMNFLNGTIYISIAIFSICFLVELWATYYPAQKLSLAEAIILSAICAVIAVYTFLCQQETFDDNTEVTKDYFNTNVSFVALIVALIALIKGVT